MKALLNNLVAPQATIAVDFAADAVRVVALGHAAHGGVDVRHAFTLPAVDLTQGMPESVSRVFAARVRAAGLVGARARVTMSAISFQTEIATLPALEESELAASARFEAIGRLGVDEADTIIRHVTLGGTGDSRQVLLLTLPALTARHAAEAVVASGLRPECMEHAAFAALTGACGMQPELQAGLTAMVHVEPRAATVMLYREGRVVFVRALRGEWSIAAQSMPVSAVSHEGDIPLEPVDPEAGWRWSSLAEESLRCLRQCCGETSWPDRMVVIGAAATDRALIDALHGVCGMPVAPATCGTWATANFTLDAGWVACLGAASRSRASETKRRAA